MPISIRLGDQLEHRLGAVSKRLRVNKSEVVKRSLEAYLDQLEPGKTAYQLGEDLFGADASMISDVSANYKAVIKKKLRAKHRR
jgi:predicted DNA-binding protein